MNYEENDYIRVYKSLLRNLGLDSPGCGIKLSYEDFKAQFCFYTLDLTGCPCQNSLYHAGSEKRGSISVDIEFDKAPTENLQLVAFGTSPKVLSIDSLRSAKLNH